MVLATVRHRALTFTNPLPAIPVHLGGQLGSDFVMWTNGVMWGGAEFCVSLSELYFEASRGAMQQNPLLLLTPQLCPVLHGSQDTGIETFTL